MLDVRGFTTIADYMLVTTASSPPHAAAIAEAVEAALEAAGGRLHHREGTPPSPWILLDGHDVLAHIFDAAARRRYDLERLWVDAPRVPWRARAAPRKAR